MCSCINKTDHSVLHVLYVAGFLATSDGNRVLELAWTRVNMMGKVTFQEHR